MSKRPDSVEPVTVELFGKIRAYRKARKISLPAAAEATGICKGYWSEVERGLRRATVHTADRMARGVGMRLDVVPLESDPDPVQERRTFRPTRVSPTLARLVATLRRQREAIGLTQQRAAARAGLQKSTWGNLERGWHQGREVGIDRMDAAARAVEMRLALVADHQMPLLELDPTEVETLARLVRWYCARAPRPPEAMMEIRDKLTGRYPGTEQSEERAA